MNHTPARPRSRLALPSRLTFTLGLTLGLAHTLAPGCSDSGGPGAMPDLLSPFSSDAIKLTIGPVDLQPGQETTMCVTAHLPTQTAIDVVQIDTRQQSSHHIIFYRDDAMVEDSPLQKCLPLDILTGTASRAPLFVGETPEAQLKLPPNVAYRLEAGQAYKLEGHFLNASPNVKQAYAEVILTPARPGASVQLADMYFLNAVTQFNKSYDGTSRRGLPPTQQTTLDPAFFGLDDDMVETKIFALTTHQHKQGIGVTVSRSTSVSETGEKLYENSDWEHPPLLRYPDDAPLTFKRGEGFRFECTYKNPTDRYIGFGQSAERDEMCITWAYYYPSMGFIVRGL